MVEGWADGQVDGRRRGGDELTEVNGRTDGESDGPVTCGWTGGGTDGWVERQDGAWTEQKTENGRMGGRMGWWTDGQVV